MKKFILLFCYTVFIAKIRRTGSQTDEDLYLTVNDAGLEKNVKREFVCKFVCKFVC